jgi:signal peptidase I
LSKKINDNSRKKDIKVIVIIAIIFVVAFVLVRVALSNSNPFYVVASGSMVPVLNVNDLIVVWGKDNNTSFDSAKVGDIIVFKAFIAEPGEKEGKTIVHRVASVFEEGETLRGNAEMNRLCYPVSVPAVLEDKTILTKGDANECSIPGVDIPITEENYIGKVVYTVPQVGIIPAFLKPPVNYIIMAVIGGLLVASFIKSNKKQEENVKDE